MAYWTSDLATTFDRLVLRALTLLDPDEQSLLESLEIGRRHNDVVLNRKPSRERTGCLQKS